MPSEHDIEMTRIPFRTSSIRPLRNLPDPDLVLEGIMDALSGKDFCWKCGGKFTYTNATDVTRSATGLSMAYTVEVKCSGCGYKDSYSGRMPTDSGVLGCTQTILGRARFKLFYPARRKIRGVPRLANIKIGADGGLFLLDAVTNRLFGPMMHMTGGKTEKVHCPLCGDESADVIVIESEKHKYLTYERPLGDVLFSSLFSCDKCLGGVVVHRFGALDCSKYIIAAPRIAGFLHRVCVMSELCEESFHTLLKGCSVDLTPD